MRWPWQQRIEVRESSYTSALVASIARSASGSSVPAASATGALEACSGLVARCFAAAQVSGPPHLTRALTPHVLSMIGRALVRSGEILFAIDTEDGHFSLLPCSSFDITGGAHPGSYRYRLTVSGPTQILTLHPVPYAGVVHIRYQSDPARPYRGIGPIQSAYLAGRLAASTMEALGDEAASPRGNLLPVPIEGGSTTLDDLKADIRTLGGSIATVENQSEWNGDGPPPPQGNWKPVRLGADPPRALVELAENASREIYAAVGIPYSLVVDGQGVGQRESYRRMLHSTIAPIARIAEAELSEKTGVEIRLSFEALFGGDLAAKSRAVSSLTSSGVELERALVLVGLSDPTD